MFAFPWLNWSLAWGLTAETGDRGEVTAGFPLLDVGCWGDLTGDKALGAFPCLLAGSLDAVETTEPDAVFADGPIFAGGCSPGVPLA